MDWNNIRRHVNDVCCFIARISRSIIVLGLPVLADVCRFLGRHLGSFVVLVLRFFGLVFRIIVNYCLGVKKKLNVDPQAIAFINKFFKQEYDDLLKENQVKLSQKQGKGEVILVSINNMIDEAKWDDSCRVIEKYINQITTREVAVSSASWEETIHQAKKRFPKALDKIHTVFKKEDQRILLKGKKEDVDSLAEKLEDLSKEIDKMIEYEKATITEKIDLTKPQFELLNFTGAIKILMAQLKDLEVRIDKNDMAIHFGATDNDSIVKEGNILIWQYLSKMKEQEMKLERSVVSILTSDAGNKFLSKQFKVQHIDAVISSSDDNNDTKLIVTAIDRREVNRAIDFIKKTTIEDSVPLAQNQSSLVLSNGWKKLLHDFEESMLFKVTTDTGSKSIRIAGIKEDVNIAKKQVLKFLKENTIIDSIVETDSGRTKYVHRFKQDEVTKIEDELKQHSVHITKNSNGEGFKICGNKQGIEKATKKMLQLVNQTQENYIEIEKPGIKKLFSDNKGQKLLSNIEDDQKCIIEQCSPSDENSTNTVGDTVNAAAASQTKQKRIATKDHQPSLKAIPDIKIDVIVGDIAKTKTHAIVNSVASDLDFTSNKSAKALSDAAGPRLQQECQWKGPLKPGDVLVTEGYKLGCKNVFHVVASYWDNGNSEKVLRALMVSCLKEAHKRGFSSIAFPAIGTGVLGFPRSVVAKAFFEEVNAFNKKHPKTSILEVHFVLFHRDQPTIDAFQKEQKSWGKRTKRKRRSQPFKELEKEQGYTSISESSDNWVFSWLENLIVGGGDENKALYPSYYQMYLRVFAFSESTLKEANTAINKLIKEQSKRKVIDKPAIEGLSQTQEQHILRLQEKYLTEIQIHKRSAKIIINGLSEDVADTVVAIYEILNEKTEAEHERRIAELVSTTVQWYCDESGEREPYDVETNAKIEAAFKETKKSVMITLFDENDKVEYMIHFDTMKEINLDTHYETDVHREEQGKGIPLPHHWDSQPKDANGKEKDLHLVKLDPFKNQQEYDRIQNAVIKSSPINIVKIQRVQNPELYRGYMVKKQKMDDKDGSNEKKLFHGTAVDTCKLINHKGFNRSYCGKNATVYGKGVYFARDASYSMQGTYSPPDRNGKRRMYLACVLVGQFTVGNHKMIAPPQKHPRNPTITYDTTVNDVNDPEMFVAYHDNQVYPEYLITFY